MKPVHSQRLERWLGTERIENLSRNMRGWYGPPVPLLDVPGGVRVHGDGDFSGVFTRGYFGSAMDALWDAYKRAARSRQLNAGFASISDALAQASSGKTSSPGGNILKLGSTGVAGAASSLWRQTGGQPAGGAAGSAAPGGRAPVDSDTGGMLFANPAAGTSRLVGSDFNSSVAGNSLLLYDRIFDVAKTMSSTGTEAVTGVPTRYQSQTAADEDYIGGNFIFPEVFAALGAGAHNWTDCQYTDQGGTTGISLPSFTGVASAIIDRIDHATQWFMPLASGDVGIKALTQMQCSASITGSINFVMGHPLGFVNFPVALLTFPFDWLTNRNQAPRVFDDACLALMEMPKPATTATAYTGRIYLTSTSA